LYSAQDLGSTPSMACFTIQIYGEQMDNHRLTTNNIDEVIIEYKAKLNNIPLHIKADSFIEFMNKIKREKINYGPYPDVTLFEASNRIMTDLVILYGVKMLLDGKKKEISFDEYFVEYGNEDNNDHDVTATKDGRILKCEAFNVSSSFFQTKKSKMLKKLRSNIQENEIRLLLFNDDALKEKQELKLRDDEYYLAVKIEL
jgi:hypothetical protein